MAISNVWNVVQLDAYPQADGQTDVVFNVHWTLTGSENAVVDGKDKVCVGSVYGAQGLTLDPEAAFTPYASLTEAQVIGWVKAALGEEQVESLEANVAQQIADQINPPVVQPALPW